MSSKNSLILKNVYGSGAKFTLPMGKDDKGMAHSVTTDYPPDEFTAEAFAKTADSGGSLSITGSVAIDGVDGKGKASRKDASKARVLELAGILAGNPVGAGSER